MKDLNEDEVGHLGGYTGRSADDGLAGNQEIVGDGFVGLDEILAGDGFVGASQRGAQTNSTDLEKTAKGTGSAFVGASQRGPQTNSTDLEKTAKGTGSAFVGAQQRGPQTNSTTLERDSKGTGIAFVGNAFVGDGFVGADKRGAGERAKAEGLYRQILSDARSGKEIPVQTVAQYLGAVSRTHMLDLGKPISKPNLERARQALYADVADAGGKIRGAITGLGAWYNTLARGVGKVVGKGTELTVNVAKGVVWDVPKAGFQAAKALTYTPIKSTFSSPSSGKKTVRALPVSTRTATAARAAAGTATAATALRAAAPYRKRGVAPAQDVDVQSYAQRIAAQQADVRTRKAALQSRLELAESQKNLAAAEAADEAALAELETRAATAEAEAMQAEADAQESAEDSSEGDNNAFVGRNFDLSFLSNKATQARVAKAVFKASGPYAKAAIMMTPAGQAVKFAQQVYKEAKVDPNGPARVDAIRAAAETGNPSAKTAMEILQMGKKADEELAASTLANRQLVQETVKDAAKKTGAADVSGDLPTSDQSVANVPGAKKIYHLARAGHVGAALSVKRASRLLQRCEQGDARAREKVQALKSRADAGDASAQTDVATLAVAAAGLREGKKAEDLAGVCGAAAAVKTTKTALVATAPKGTAPNVALQRAEQKIQKMFGGMSLNLFGKRYGDGLAVKLAQR